MVRFWNSIATMNPDTYHYKDLISDLRLAITDGRETFRGTLMQQIKKIEYYTAGLLGYDKIVPIDISVVKDLL
jgi:hypothetical protein